MPCLISTSIPASKGSAHSENGVHTFGVAFHRGAIIQIPGDDPGSQVGQLLCGSRLDLARKGCDAVALLQQEPGHMATLIPRGSDDYHQAMAVVLRRTG